MRANPSRSTPSRSTPSRSNPSPSAPPPSSALVNHARRRLLEAFPFVDSHPDLAGVLRAPSLLALLGPALADPYRGSRITKVLAPEARGPILGALVALQLDAGLVLARKENRNHPGADVRVRSEPGWRGEGVDFQARSFDLGSNDRVLVVDDWITTGSTIDAMLWLVAEAGASLAGVAAVVDKADEATRLRLGAHTLVDFEALMERSARV